MKKSAFRVHRKFSQPGTVRQKRKDQDMFWLEKVKISEVSEFSILPYTQNRKLGNLGKCSFTSNFDSSCNLKCKSDKNLIEAKT